MAFPTPPHQHQQQQQQQQQETTTNTGNPTATTRGLIVYNRPPTNPHPIYQTTSRPLSNPNPNYPQLAPRSTNGRGFIRPTNSPQLFPHPNPYFIRPNATNHIRPPVNTPNAGLLQRQQLPKVAGTSSALLLDGNANGHKQQQFRNRDDVPVVVIRDRKVRVNNNAPLYSFCRSWLRNGFPEEAQSQYLDTVKALPKPLPLAAESLNSADKKEGDKEETDEDEGSVEQLSTKELLQRHVKRAKRVRSRLREERLERITRYKTRLALLLPPMMDQSPLKNETN